ncbi:ABC transporter substrate-binding protein [Methylobacterium nonmethylotrophicum]|uniref:Solute-binding protein family 5 domain-containing protein n=1 Tax=Methylobacterium nonmethylotrophicum TaxID=1141884 RepID=A0A4Z0NQU2_9HYPH|nr:ABC transporter substrate-binding protein [Methylobacterium nonmethylotrophicum]TGD99402.1 hypothetical protein EU555_12900 [Methylobacterium nonmethylotrophicum]
MSPRAPSCDPPAPERRRRASRVPARLPAPAETPERGGTRDWASFPGPPALIAINTTSGTGQTYSLRYRFNLRRDVSWHDGQPFTAAAIAFSLLRLREAHQLRQRPGGADAHSVEIVLSRPAPFLISAFAGAESTPPPAPVRAADASVRQPRHRGAAGSAGQEGLNPAAAPTAACPASPEASAPACRSRARSR